MKASDSPAQQFLTSSSLMRMQSSAILLYFTWTMGKHECIRFFLFYCSANYTPGSERSGIKTSSTNQPNNTVSQATFYMFRYMHYSLLKDVEALSILGSYLQLRKTTLYIIPFQKCVLCTVFWINIYFGNTTLIKHFINANIQGFFLTGAPLKILSVSR